MRAVTVVAKLFDERFTRELFVHVLLYWRSARATGEDRDGDEQRLRDERQRRRDERQRLRDERTSAAAAEAQGS